MFGVENAHHLVFSNDQYGRGCNRRGRPHADILTCQASLAKEIAGAQYRNDCLFANLIDNGQFYAAFLDIHDARGGLTLRVDFL